MAQTGTTRIALIPNVPTMIEAGVPDFVVESWFGVFGPKGLPESVTAKLTRAIAATQGNPDVQRRFTEAGVEAADVPPAEFQRSSQPT